MTVQAYHTPNGAVSITSSSHRNREEKPFTESLERIRELLLNRRNKLGLQCAFYEKLGVVYSFIDKVETIDRRLDIFEFIEYYKGVGARSC